MKVRKIRANLPVAGEERGSRRTQMQRQRVVSGKRTALMSHHTQAEVHFLLQPQSMPCLICAAIFLPLPPDFYFTLISVGRLFFNRKRNGTRGLQVRILPRSALLPFSVLLRRGPQMLGALILSLQKLLDLNASDLRSWST